MSGRIQMREIKIPRKRYDWALKEIGDAATRMQRAEFFHVAEALGFEFGIVWNEQEDGRMKVTLSDLQLFAFAAALKVHREITFPSLTEDKKKRTRNGSDQHTGRRT